MKNFTLILVFAILGLINLHAQENEPQPIPGQYIIALKESAALPVALQETPSETREGSAEVNQQARNANLAKLSQVRRTAGIAEEKVIAEFADALVGFSATLSEAEVAQLSLCFLASLT